MGVENESKLEADVSSVSKEIGDEAFSLDECEHSGDGTTAPQNELSSDVHAMPEAEGTFAEKDTHGEPAAGEPQGGDESSRHGGGEEPVFPGGEFRRRLLRGGTGRGKRLGGY